MKYGVENHTFEIIEVCVIDELKCRERYWQEYYDVLGENGLNCQYTECGELKQVHTQETKDKIGKAHKGRDSGKIKIFTEEHKNKISEAAKGEGNSQYGKTGVLSPNFGREGLRGEKHPHWGKCGELSPSYGKKHSEETIKLRAEKLMKLVLNLETGIFYDSCLEASTALGISAKRLSTYLSGSRTNKTSLIYV